MKTKQLKNKCVALLKKAIKDGRLIEDFSEVEDATQYFMVIHELGDLAILHLNDLETVNLIRDFAKTNNCETHEDLIDFLQYGQTEDIHLLSYYIAEYTLFKEAEKTLNMKIYNLV
tara:strand:+ start:214 stop:561 length:348 start_codon:yes stop_codon:yes gene_type:complete